jgi:hypothetical protein
MKLLLPCHAICVLGLHQLHIDLLLQLRMYTRPNVNTQREGEACLVSALTNFKASMALGGATDELKIIVQQLDVVLDGAITLSQGGSFGF